MRKILEGQVKIWKKTSWVVFTQDKQFQKKFSVRVGERDYRVTHGDEVVYEGWRLKMAIRIYNKINKPPIEK